MLIHFIHDANNMQTLSYKSNEITRAGKLYQIEYIINSEIMTQVNQILTYDRLSRKYTYADLS